MTTETDRVVQRLLDANADLVERVDRVRCTGSRGLIDLAPVRESLHDLAEWAVRYGGVIVGGTHGGPSGVLDGAWRVVFESGGCRVEVCLVLSRAEANPVLFGGDCA